MAPQRDNRVKVSALLRAGHKVSEVANLVEMSRTTVYALKKRVDEGVTRRRIVVDRLLWIVTACRMSLEELLCLRDSIRETVFGVS